MDIPSEEDIQHPYVDTTSNASVPLALPVISCMPHVAQYKEQEDMPQQVQGTGNVPGAASSRSSLRPGGERTTTKPQHSCDICGKTYSQPQGVRRHQRETHKASLCVICKSFEWGRPYRLRQHLKRWHPDVVDIEAVLAEATGTRRGVTTDSRCLPQQPAPLTPRAPHHYRPSSAASPPDRRLVPTSSSDPPLAVVNFPSVTSPRGLSPEVDYMGAKVEEQRPLRKKIGLAPGGPGCGTHTRRRARGFGVVN